jgi:hypothetical protein
MVYQLSSAIVYFLRPFQQQFFISSFTHAVEAPMERSATAAALKCTIFRRQVIDLIRFDGIIYDLCEGEGSYSRKTIVADGILTD